MTLPRLYDSDRTRSPWEASSSEPGSGNAILTVYPEDDEEAEREFRVWIMGLGGGDWEIHEIEERVGDRWIELRGYDYDEIHEIALYDPGVEARGRELAG